MIPTNADALLIRKDAAATGVPVELLYLQDALFEGLHGDASSQFAVAFAAALRNGQDLSRVSDLFLAETLRDDVLPLVTDDHQNVRAVVTRVADGCADGWQNDDRAAEAAVAEAARAATWAARATGATGAARAARAARAAVEAARAAEAAEAAVEAAWAARATGATGAARAAVEAAWAATWATGATGAARAAAYQRMADRLVRLIGEAA